jgi:hypothetical protein
MEPDPDGRLVRRPETRRSADLTTFATKGQICTYLRLDHVNSHDESDWGQSDVSLDHPPLNRCNLLRRRGKIGIIIFEALLFRARIIH